MVRFLTMLWYVSVCLTYTGYPTDHLQGFSSHYIYDFTEMNEALPGQPSHSSSRRSFTPYELTSGSRTQTKVRQIREDGRHQRKS